GLGRWFRRRNRRPVEELAWWQSRRVGKVEVTMVPSRHWSRRGLADVNRSHWGGFVLRTVGRAGDAPVRHLPHPQDILRHGGSTGKPRDLRTGAGVPQCSRRRLGVRRNHDSPVTTRFDWSRTRHRRSSEFLARAQCPSAVEDVGGRQAQLRSGAFGCFKPGSVRSRRCALGVC
ncbi:MAG: hypothetical protein GY953_56435, partial [bacterium]|nr:hypothetical protein [bacterium]